MQCNVAALLHITWTANLPSNQRQHRTPVAFVQKTRGDAMVTGTVFCDQCKDGHRRMKVRVTCDSMEKEETTNWLGSYTVSFEGSPDLSGCYAHLLEDGQGSTNCGAVAGPAQQLKLMFKIFGMEMYAVDSLLSQPAHPMLICPAVHPPPSPVGAAPRPPSPVGAVPSPRLPSSPVGVVPRPPSPVGGLPRPVGYGNSGARCNLTPCKR
ncbi:hypothetical protein AQUCO_00900568v1 [Aquilegia coerulea]|uniref:Uncharacterized protein n=1 Tax=Aquilegia coerulea TaxID=218851 RepID=A0A2G5EET2_AQUCA|nr:hypothetical protein AQUCO_00900568v1 [Aquilegia coerulea]